MPIKKNTKAFKEISQPSCDCDPSSVDNEDSYMNNDVDQDGHLSSVHEFDEKFEEQKQTIEDEERNRHTLEDTKRDIGMLKSHFQPFRGRK